MTWNNSRHSPYLLFQFYQKVYFLNAQEKFPSTKECAGQWLGVCENVGDLLTFWILTDDTEVVIARSVMRPADVDKTSNKRITWDPDLDPEGYADDVTSEMEVKTNDGTISATEADGREAARIRANSRLKSKRRNKKQQRADAK